MILIPKGKADTQGIELLEVLWKVVGSIIDTCIKKAVTFHDFLNGFRAGGRTRTAIMELKLAQELESVYQDLLFLVFLDLRKAYDNLYCGRLLKTLEGYWVGPKMRVVLADLWARQEVFTRQNGYHGPQFRATRRTTQGGLKFLTLFIVVVYNAVRHWISVIVEDDAVIHDGLVNAVGQSMVVFYA